MALDYAQSAALMSNAAFRDRAKVGCLKYADYILAEAITVPAHSTRLKWAQAVYRNPDSEAQQIMPGLVMDPKVQDAGVDADGNSNITDPDLQSAVEATVNKYI